MSNFCKAAQVVNSCETLDQLRVAKRYAELYCEKELGIRLLIATSRSYDLWENSTFSKRNKVAKDLIPLIRKKQSDLTSF